MLPVSAQIIVLEVRFARSQGVDPSHLDAAVRSLFGVTCRVVGDYPAAFASSSIWDLANVLWTVSTGGDIESVRGDRPPQWRAIQSRMIDELIGESVERWPGANALAMAAIVGWRLARKIGGQ